MSKLQGVITAIPTPLLPSEDVDIDGLCRVIDYVIEQGVSGIFVLRSMGEGPALLDSQKKVVVETAAKHINGRVPLLAGISDVSTRRTIEMGLAIQKLGPDHLVSAPPYYYRFPHPQSIIDFMTELSDALSKPMVFYNIPGATGNRVTLEAIEAIMNIPDVIAIKDSSGDSHLVMELLRRYPDKKSRPCSILQGDEFVYDITLLMGADGLVTGGGTCFVGILVELYKAATKGDKLLAFKLQQKFRKKMDEMLGPELLIDWMHAVKKELGKKGLCDDNVTSPFLKRK